MRTGLMILATAATLGAAAIGAAPASAQYYGHHDGYRDHRGGDRGDRWDRHRDWQRDHRRHEREREWHHHNRHYGYNGYYGRGYYGY